MSGFNPKHDYKREAAEVQAAKDAANAAAKSGSPIHAKQPQVQQGQQKPQVEQQQVQVPPRGMHV